MKGVTPFFNVPPTTTRRMTDPRTDYLTKVSLGKAILEKRNYEAAVKNLTFAKQAFEEADETQKEKTGKALAYAERAVLYCRAIMEGLFADPNPPSSTIMYVMGCN